jgi:pimeloyl-ACP methyl ester carboxylesterase
MTAVPTWFGPHDRPLFGWLHVPDDGQALGAVVCCPTMGVEYISSSRAMATLAQRLEASGYLVFRFDYDGTGDSCGDESEPGRLAAWLSSVRAALALVRQCGATRVGLVGFRIGGTLAAIEAARDGAIDALVLWDPCPGGRSFVREQQVLKTMSIGQPATEGVVLEAGATEVLGSVLSAETTADLWGLDMTDLTQPLAKRTLALVRDDRPTPSRLLRCLGTEHTEWGVATGQADLIDVLPDLAVLPAEAIDVVVEWVRRALIGEPVAVTPVVRAEAILRAPAPGTVLVERPVRFEPLGIFGMLAESMDPPLGPTVVFLNAGLINHVGPARLWVLLSRRLAAAGFRCLRLDLSGLGESPARPGRSPNIACPPEAIEDMATVIGAISSDPEADVVLLGLCAGAYHSIESGIAIKTRGICAINPMLSFEPPEAQVTGTVDARRQAVQPLRRWIKRMGRMKRLAAFGDYRVPPSAWWLLDRVGLQPHPARGFELLVSQGASTLIICGEEDARPFLRRAKWSMRRMIRSGQLQFEVVPAMDHALYGASARTRVADLITGYMLSNFLPVALPREPVRPAGSHLTPPRVGV